MTPQEKISSQTDAGENALPERIAMPNSTAESSHAAAPHQPQTLSPKPQALRSRRRPPPANLIWTLSAIVSPTTCGPRCESSTASSPFWKRILAPSWIRRPCAICALIRGNAERMNQLLDGVLERINRRPRPSRSQWSLSPPAPAASRPRARRK